MNSFQCVSCGGVYNESNPDGSIYHHCCPAVTNPVTGVTTETPNRRNEVIALDVRGRATGIIAAGKGVAPHGATVVIEPTWITKLNQQVAALAAS